MVDLNPISRMIFWKNVLLTPTKELTAKKRGVEIAQGAVDIAISSIILSLVLPILMLISFEVTSKPEYMYNYTNYPASLAWILIIQIGGLVLVGGLSFGAAKILGGRCNFKWHQNAYLSAQNSAVGLCAVLYALLLFYLLFENFIDSEFYNWMMWHNVPFLVVILPALYLVYMIYLIQRKLHELTKAKAIIASAGLALVLFVLFYSIILLRFLLSPEVSW